MSGVKLDLSYPFRRFWRGVVRWSQNGEINLKTDKGIIQINALMKLLCDSPAADCYDGNFNGLSPKVVASSLNFDIDAEEYHSDGPHSYRVELIQTFAQAQEFRKYAPDWCIIQSEYAYDEHAGYGKNRIYFCIRDDMEKVPAFPGENFPHDEYGYSLIAVIVAPDGEILSTTSRWNYGDVDYDDFLTPEQLQKLLTDI